MKKKNVSTEMGKRGLRGAFPETSMGLVSNIRNPERPGHRTAMERLCEKYWSPVYHFIRPWWTHSNEDAKDLTQGYLLWLIESEALVRYDAERGSFRNFLKVLLRRYLAREAKAQNRLKRGGGKKIVSLDDEPGLAPESGAADPDEAFDRALMDQLLTDAIAHVREKYESRDRGHCVAIFEEYDLGDDEKRPTYAELAEKHGVKESDVRNYLFSVREAVRNRMRTQLAQMTPDADSLETEWRDLMGG